MNFKCWLDGAEEFTGVNAFEFISAHGLENQFPEISTSFEGALVVYPGVLVITQSTGLFRLVIGNTERTCTQREPLEKALFRWAWDQERLVA